MTARTTFIALGTAIVAGAGFWWSGRPGPLPAPRLERPPLVATVPVRKTGSVAAREPTVVGMSRSAEPLAQVGGSQEIARIHAALKQYLERDADADANEEECLDRLLADVTATNVAELVPALSTAELQTRFGTAVLTLWLSSDTRAATVWLAEHTGPTVEQAAVIGRALLNTPKVLEELERGLPAGEWRQALLQSAALTIADTDSAAAMTWANRLSAGATQTGTYETIVYAWAARDAVSLQAWLGGVGDEALRQRLFASSAKAVAMTDPDLAAKWLGTATTPVGSSHDTALVIVEAWTEKDPGAASAWVSALTDPTTRTAAGLMLARQWTASDPKAAAAWLAKFPDRDVIEAKLREEAAERIAMEP